MNMKFRAVVQRWRWLVGVHRFRPSGAETGTVDEVAISSTSIGTHDTSRSSTLSEGFWRELDLAEAEISRRAQRDRRWEPL